MLRRSPRCQGVLAQYDSVYSDEPIQQRSRGGLRLGRVAWAVGLLDLAVGCVMLGVIVLVSHLLAVHGKKSVAPWNITGCVYPAWTCTYERNCHRLLRPSSGCG